MTLIGLSLPGLNRPSGRWSAPNGDFEVAPVRLFFDGGSGWTGEIELQTGALFPTALGPLALPKVLDDVGRNHVR